MLKYGEALAHSDALAKHSICLQWKFLEMKKPVPFFCQKFYIILSIDFSVLQTVTVGIILT